MRKGTQKITLIVIVILIGVLLLMLTKGQAATFDEQFTAASSSMPLGADVAGMGGIGTLEEFSSNNPAITSITKEGNVSSTVNYGIFNFERMRLETVSASVTGKVGNVVLQIGAGRGESKNGWIDESNSFRIKENNSVNFQLGGKISNSLFIEGDETYLGVGYAFAQSIQDGSSIISQSTPIVNFSTDSKSHGATLGVAYKLNKQITLGGFESRTWTKSTTSFDGVLDAYDSNSFYDVGRVGFAAKLRKGTILAADYQHVSFSGSNTKFDQFYVGVEQYLLEDFLAVYMGNTNGGMTAGLGMYFKNGGINVSFGKNTLREVNDSFGSCESYMFSGYLNF